MQVVSQTFPNNFQQQIAAQQQHLQFNSSMNGRQCATLPRKMASGTKLPAPMPPRRDPKTTLSVGRARAKSMVAGLEGGSTDKDDDDLPATTKSSSAESIHQQSLSSASTPTQGGPGTPIQLRTASIKARPTSSRITAAELEELFQRQQGESTSEHRYSTMMCSSRFQSGTDSGTATPPASPQRGPIVYASVAEMKRKKNKMGTLRGKPCAIPTISSDLKRTFHSTPDLATGLSSSTASIWSNGNGFKGHRSQDDMYSLHASMQRLNLPPPNHPPPPPPIGQVVKVDVSRGSEYESTVKLQKQLQMQMQQNQSNSTANADESNEIRSSFKPATNAKLYASPQDLRNVAYRANGVPPPAQTQSMPPPPLANEQKANTMVLKIASFRISVFPRFQSLDSFLIVGPFELIIAHINQFDAIDHFVCWFAATSNQSICSADSRRHIASPDDQSYPVVANERSSTANTRPRLQSQ